MRCGKADGLIEAYVDGALPAVLAGELALHLESCARCSARAEAARRISASLARSPRAKAPAGFAARVMDAVHRAALAGAPYAARGEAEKSAGIPPRSFKRLGYSFLLTAAVFTGGLFIPAAAFPKTGITKESAAGTVRNALEGAGRAVQGALHSMDAPRSADTGGIVL